MSAYMYEPALAFSHFPDSKDATCAIHTVHASQMHEQCYTVYVCTLLSLMLQDLTNQYPAEKCGVRACEQTWPVVAYNKFLI